LHMAQLMPLPLTVSCFSKIQIGFSRLTRVFPNKGPLNGCVYLSLSSLACRRQLKSSAGTLKTDGSCTSTCGVLLIISCCFFPAPVLHARVFEFLAVLIACVVLLYCMFNRSINQFIVILQPEGWITQSHAKEMTSYTL